MTPKMFSTGIHRGETHDVVADTDPAYIVRRYEKGDHSIDPELYKACVDTVEEQNDNNSYRELEL